MHRGWVSARPGRNRRPEPGSSRQRPWRVQSRRCRPRRPQPHHRRTPGCAGRVMLGFDRLGRSPVRLPAIGQIRGWSSGRTCKSLPSGTGPQARSPGLPAPPLEKARSGCHRQTGERATQILASVGTPPNGRARSAGAQRNVRRQAAWAAASPSHLVEMGNRAQAGKRAAAARKGLHRFRAVNCPNGSSPPRRVASANGLRGMFEPNYFGCSMFCGTSNLPGLDVGALGPHRRFRLRRRHFPSPKAMSLATFLHQAIGACSCADGPACRNVGDRRVEDRPEAPERVGEDGVGVARRIVDQ